MTQTPHCVRRLPSCLQRHILGFIPCLGVTPTLLASVCFVSTVPHARCEYCDQDDGWQQAVCTCVCATCHFGLGSTLYMEIVAYDDSERFKVCESCVRHKVTKSCVLFNNIYYCRPYDVCVDHVRKFGVDYIYFFLPSRPTVGVANRLCWRVIKRDHANIRLHIKCAW